MKASIVTLAGDEGSPGQRGNVQTEPKRSTWPDIHTPKVSALGHYHFKEVGDKMTSPTSHLSQKGWYSL